MAAEELAPVRPVAPVASVWCRQVDNEAESPGYTAIPDEFPGRRETLEAIRLVGNLTINAADTHDYWDPDPTSTLSYYPNLFVYPAASGKYTCVGRMFLSTEDRPRLGMKTLVFATSELVETGAFGELVVRALATLDGRPERPAPDLAPDTSIYQAAGEGFLFHRGSTEPVVVVASEQWEATTQVVTELLRSMPASLVALGAFLVFPYFLPATKVDLHQFAEEVPLALAVMRVPRQEADGDRHTKRMQGWDGQPVSLRDLTRSTTGRAKDALPLVLQYVRDHADGKEGEVARRVDQVERPRLAAHLSDPDRQRGRERRREMWRIGTAMETAALLLSRPKGRAVKISPETQKRVSQYLDARPGEAISVPPPPAVQLPGELSGLPASVTTSGDAAPAGATAAPGTALASPSTANAAPAAASASAVPGWLRPPIVVQLPPRDPAKVPMPTGDDPSLAVVPSLSTVARPSTPFSPSRPSPAAPASVARVAPPPDLAALDLKIAKAAQELEQRWSATSEARLREVTEASTRAVREALAPVLDRLASLEQRPVVSADAIRSDVEGTVRTEVGSAVSTSEHRLSESFRETSESWADRLRRELKVAVDQLAARYTRAEEELRTSLAAQVDLEMLDAREQGTALREELEGRVRGLLETSRDDQDRRRSEQHAELEAKVSSLVDGRTRDLEKSLNSALADRSERITATVDDRISHVERRLGAERDARLSDLTEAHRAALAALQGRTQALLDQKLRDGRAEDEQRTLALLARLKTELETSVDRKLTAPEFAAGIDGRIHQAVEASHTTASVQLAQAVGQAEAKIARTREEAVEQIAAVRERLDTQIAQAIEASRVAQSSQLAEAVGVAEEKIARTREEAVARIADMEQRIEARNNALANLEDALRSELDDLDRRLLVVNDHVLPLVRQTWLKVSEQEFASRAKVTEARLAAVRQELAEEVRRVEGELLQQQSDLRDRLEASVASHGRIWLNLLRQLSPEGKVLVANAGGAPSQRLDRRLREAGPSVLTPAETAALPADGLPFAADPPNPMDPELGHALEPKEPRGRSRRP